MVLVLLMVATPAMASWDLELSHRFDDANRFLIVDVTLKSSTFANDIDIYMFESGLILGGADIGLFPVFMNPVSNRTMTQMNTFCGGNFAFTDFTKFNSVAAPSVSAIGFLSDGFVVGQDDDWNDIYAYHPANSYEGKIVATFVFRWALENTALITGDRDENGFFKTLDITADLVAFTREPGTLPLLRQEYIDGTANALPVTVANQGYDLGVIPEPATMGLLGLGLVGLIARRRSSRK